MRVANRFKSVVTNLVVSGAPLGCANPAMRTTIVLNISGDIFETYPETLSRFPSTLLGDKSMRSQFYCARTDQYFFQRSRTCFQSILHFYQSHGSLICPLGTLVSIFEDECRYFHLPNDVIDSMKVKEGIISGLDVDNMAADDTKSHSLRARISNALENPSSSFAAWIFGMTSLVVVCLSVFTASLETMQCFHSSENVWAVIDFVLNTWLLFELLLRIIFSHSVLDFLTNSLNLLEIGTFFWSFLSPIIHYEKSSDY